MYELQATEEEVAMDNVRRAYFDLVRILERSGAADDEDDALDQAEGFLRRLRRQFDDDPDLILTELIREAARHEDI